MSPFRTFLFPFSHCLSISDDSIIFLTPKFGPPSSFHPSGILGPGSSGHLTPSPSVPLGNFLYISDSGKFTLYPSLTILCLFFNTYQCFSGRG